jgi:hypothetical protein
MGTNKSKSVLPWIIKRALQIILLITAFVLGSAGAQTKSPTVGQGLWISGSSTRLGGVSGRPDMQDVSYSLTLQNNESHPVTLVDITPVLAVEVSQRLVQVDTRVMVGKVVSPGGILEVQNEFQFNSKGVTKTQIDSWGQLVKGFRVTTDQTLNLQTVP